jgi:hypothetical protein
VFGAEAAASAGAAPRAAPRVLLRREVDYRAPRVLPLPVCLPPNSSRGREQPSARLRRISHWANPSNMSGSAEPPAAPVEGREALSTQLDRLQTVNIPVDCRWPGLSGRRLCQAGITPSPHISADRTASASRTIRRSGPKPSSATATGTPPAALQHTNGNSSLRLFAMTMLLPCALSHDSDVQP